MATSEGRDALDPQSTSDAPARAVLLMFAAAREAAGTGRAEIRARTVGEALDRARAEFGRDFSSVLDRCRVWLNGEPVELGRSLSDGDEVAVLPPVSGGSDDRLGGTR